MSGFVGIDVGTGALAGPTIEQQTRQALSNCEAVLRAGGSSLDDVVDVGVLLANPADFAGMNEEYELVRARAPDSLRSEARVFSCQASLSRSA